MEPCLFTYSATCSQTGVHAMLNATDAIHNWVSAFPHSAILVSNLDTRELSAIPCRQLNGAWFVVARIESQSIDGWLPCDYKQFVNSPGEASLAHLLPQQPSPPPRGIGGLVGSAIGWTKRLAGSAMERKSLQAVVAKHGDTGCKHALVGHCGCRRKDCFKGSGRNSRSTGCCGGAYCVHLSVS